MGKGGRAWEGGGGHAHRQFTILSPMVLRFFIFNNLFHIWLSLRIYLISVYPPFVFAPHMIDMYGLRQKQIRTILVAQKYNSIHIG